MPITRERFVALSVPTAATAAVLPARAPAAQFQYKLGHGLSASHPIGVAANEFAAGVKRESGGRMEIKVFPDSVLGTDTAMLSQLRTGALEMNLQGNGPLSAVAPVAGVFLIGFPFRGHREAMAATNGTLGALVRKGLEDQGIHAFENAWSSEFRQITTSDRPIRTVDDLVGLRIRIVPAKIPTDMFKTLGASPVPMDQGELYTALQAHVVDSADGTFLNILSQRLYEVQRYLSVTNHQWTSYWFCMGADAWKGLPPDLQAIVRRNANLAGARESRAASLQEPAVADLLKRHGLKANDAETATFRARLAGYYDRWRKEFGPTVWSALEEYSGKL